MSTLLPPQAPGGFDRHELLRQFQQKSLEAMHAEEQRAEKRHQSHAQEEVQFARRGAEFVVDTKAAEKRSAEHTAQWRAAEQERKAAVEAEKAQKAQAQKVAQEKKEKEERYQKQRKEYFVTLHADAVRRAAADKRAAERELARTEGIQKAEREAYAAKLKAGGDEVMAKEQLERSAEQEREEITKEYTDRMEELHKDEELRTFRIQTERDQRLAQLEGQKTTPGYQGQAAAIDRECNAKLKSLADEMAHKRLEAEERKATRRRALEADTIRQRTAAEQTTRTLRYEADKGLAREKADLNRRFGKE